MTARAIFRSALSQANAARPNLSNYWLPHDRATEQGPTPRDPRETSESEGSEGSEGAAILGE